MYNHLTEPSGSEGLLGLKYELANFDIYSWLMVLAMANVCLLSSILKSAAMQRAPASYLSPYSYMKVLY